MDVPTSLPDDLDQLKQLLLQVMATQKQYEEKITQRDAILDQRDEAVEQRDKLIDQQQKRIEILEAELRLQRQKRFGASSEKLKNTTLDLFNELEWIVDNIEPPGEDDLVDIPGHKRKKRSRNLDSSLPRVEVEHDVPEQEKVCACCNELMPRIKDKITEQWAIIPAQYYVIRHIRKRYACSCKGSIVTAVMPEQVIPKSQASPQMLAYLMVSKFLDGLPLYRLEKITAREGMDLPRSKMARWLIQASEHFQPMINLIEDQFFQYDIGLADETGIQVLKEESREPEAKSYLWMRRGGPPDKPVVLVNYAPSRAGDIPLQLLDGFKGYLVTDAYAGYNPAIRKQGLTWIACNDHCRRRFKEAFDSLERKVKKKATTASTALVYYKRIYKVESRAKKLKLTAEQRYEYRQQYSVPLWKEFHAWLLSVKDGVYDEKTRNAINYALRYYDALTHYCKEGRLPISNIQCEHVAKTIAISRKNYLFSDTPAGAHASARIYSILETARANGHHPLNYLTVLLTELPAVKDLEGYEALLPWNITPEQVKQKAAGYPTLLLAA